MKSLNLGCGGRYHPDWINIDIAPHGPGVIRHDLSRGVPLPDSSCDVVYHSHVLEHLRGADAFPFMEECYRVLKPGGIVRIVTPSLEQICRLYLEKLEGALGGDTASVADYNWMMLEMCDQFVREQRGGGMLAYMRQDPLPNEAFVYERIGEEGRNLVRVVKEDGGGRVRAFREATWPTRLRWLRRYLPDLLNGARVHTLALLVLGGSGARAQAIGRFRLSGEVHHWLYDRYSLGRLMLATGFENPVVETATGSQIPDWSSFNLDTLPDGSVTKPDSMFMEAVKPEQT